VIFGVLIVFGIGLLVINGLVFGENLVVTILAWLAVIIGISGLGRIANKLGHLSKTEKSKHD